MYLFICVQCSSYCTVVLTLSQGVPGSIPWLAACVVAVSSSAQSAHVVCLEPTPHAVSEHGGTTGQPFQNQIQFILFAWLVYPDALDRIRWGWRTFFIKCLNRNCPGLSCCPSGLTALREFLVFLFSLPQLHLPLPHLWTMRLWCRKSPKKVESPCEILEFVSWIYSSWFSFVTFMLFMYLSKFVFFGRAACFPKASAALR